MGFFLHITELKEGRIQYGDCLQIVQLKRSLMLYGGIFLQIAELKDSKGMGNFWQNLKRNLDGMGDRLQN